MAKRQKTTRFSIQAFDNAHYRTTEQYARAVDALFDVATKEISQAAARGKIDPDKPFSFDDYPKIKGVMQDVTIQLADRLTTTIETGSKKQWLFACKKNDGFIASIFNTSKLSKARLNKMQDRNLDALQAFQGRKVEGLNLSERVWKYVGQYREQMETALDAGLGEGRSAQQLARDVKQNLKDPNRLFRRVRDKRGNLVLSKAARAFHPGRGVYRSSVKNAQRLTRSEINMAYRESDWQRWQSLDFVVGYEIVRSNHEPLCECDICARLVGRYPKTFKFIGWHPQCMCYAIPILMDEETFDDNELGDLKAALRGTTYKHKQAANTVTDVPDSFKVWVKDHIEAQKGWSYTPYFIRDNFKNGDLSKGLKIALPTIQQVDVLAAYRSQIAEARANATKWGLSVQLNMLELRVTNKDVSGLQSTLATITNDKREWVMSKASYKKALQELKDQINKVISESGKDIDKPHRGMKTSYTLDRELDETFKVINSDFTSEKWFEHGDLRISPTKKRGVNGFTYMDGRISLTPDRLAHVKTAMAKIGQGKSSDITFVEADAMATMWHEITHNRNIPGNMFTTSTQTDIMEMMNEFVARKTLPDFYKKLGCARIPYPEFITNRASTGYNRRVLGYDFVISKLGLDPDKVLQSAKKNLFALKYTEQETTAAQALLDGGLATFKGANGKKIGKAQLNKIVAMCRKGYGEATIENYLKEQGILASE